MVGKHTLGFTDRPKKKSEKQACASVGQARLMMIYQKLFMEYNQTAGQVLITKNTMVNDLNRFNAKNTFCELMSLGVIPIVNENDTISTYEIEFGDNDTLSAVVAALIDADLLILLSDIDGLYTDDPHKNHNARFVDVVDSLDENLISMGKESTGTDVGSGGMATKLQAARVATAAGTDMIIANGEDFHIIHRLIRGEKYGTIFPAKIKDEYFLIDYLDKLKND